MTEFISILHRCEKTAAAAAAAAREVGNQYKIVRLRKMLGCNLIPNAKSNI